MTTKVYELANQRVSEGGGEKFQAPEKFEDSNSKTQTQTAAFEDDPPTPRLRRDKGGVMTRKGKIARLQRHIRDEVNQRLDNGEPGVRIVEWLNELPEVKQVLDAEFEGKPISEVNLSEWKQGGFRDWQAQQELLALAVELKSNASELVASGGELSDSLARVLSARLAAMLQGWDGEMTDEIQAQLRGLEGFCREIARLRRGDQGIERMKMEREWLALEAKASELNERRYQDSKREVEEKALAVCLSDAKEHPKVWPLFVQAFEAMQNAREGH